MKQFTISIPDNKAELFLEIVKSISFVKKIEEGYHPDISEEHKSTVRERIKKYGNKSENYLEWDEINNQLRLDDEV